jgi:hypothetical protein
MAVCMSRKLKKFTELCSPSVRKKNKTKEAYWNEKVKQV